MDYFDLSSLVHVKMRPRFTPVCIQIFFKFLSFKVLVSRKHFFCCCLRAALRHPEGSIWCSILTGSLSSIGFDHRSHEYIISISRESLWCYPCVSMLTISTSWDEFLWQWLLLFYLLMGLFLSLYFFLFFITVGFWIWLILQKGSGLVWWSSISLSDWVLAICMLNLRVRSMVVDWF